LSETGFIKESLLPHFHSLIEKKWEYAKESILSKKIDYPAVDNFGHLLFFLSTAQKRSLFSEAFIDDMGIFVQRIRQLEDYKSDYWYLTFPFELFLIQFEVFNSFIPMYDFNGYLEEWNHQNSSIRHPVQGFLIWHYEKFDKDDILGIVKDNMNSYQFGLDLFLILLTDNIKEFNNTEINTLLYLDFTNNSKCDPDHPTVRRDGSHHKLELKLRKGIRLINPFYPKLFQTYRSFTDLLFEACIILSSGGNNYQLKIFGEQNIFSDLINLTTRPLSKLSKFDFELKNEKT